MIKRIIENSLLQLSSIFKVVAVIGPRQSGKSTLVKMLFPEKKYISLENPDVRNAALSDPRGFLASIPEGAILDEVQRVPELFSYMQEIVDNQTEKGYFILTGSNNFLLQENITQSLAGRVAFLNLLPFTLYEAYQNNNLPSIEKVLIEGFYPPLFDMHIPALKWIPNYIRTYIERDVRQLKNISDLFVFEKFLSVLAGRAGQELNLSSIATDIGIDQKTVLSWIGILENSFIIYLIKPYYKNFNKTIVKRPKIYFYDTALICYLLRVYNSEQLEFHPAKGAIFENFIMSEMIKMKQSSEIPVELFYWRSLKGYEVDLIIEHGSQTIPVEIKSGMTINKDFFKHLKYWMQLSNIKNGILIYGGDYKQNDLSGVKIVSWKDLVKPDKNILNLS